MRCGRGLTGGRSLPPMPPEKGRRNTSGQKMMQRRKKGHTIDIDQKEVGRVKITLNPDQEIVRTVREGLKRTGGYCPCRLERTEDTKCMCREFKEQINDPNFQGYCHCMLYYKSLQD